jgi:hypothetical protein
VKKIAQNVAQQGFFSTKLVHNFCREITGGKTFWQFLIFLKSCPKLTIAQLTIEFAQAGHRGRHGCSSFQGV